MVFNWFDQWSEHFFGSRWRVSINEIEHSLDHQFVRCCKFDGFRVVGDLI